MEIVPCRKVHYPDVLDLYGRAWPDDVERKMAAFRWIHDGNPFRDPERSYLLAYQDGVLAGYWGRMPVRFHHRGEPLRCVFHQEALVDPAFRRRGIARRLTREALGTPDLFLSLWHNERILALHRSHGWADLGLFRPVRKVYRAANLLRWKVANPVVRGLLEPMAKLALALRRRPPPRPAGFAVERVERFPEEVDAFFADVAPAFDFIADRGAAVLNWRFADIRHRSFTCHLARERSGGSVAGYLVTEVLDLSEEGLRRGTVVDFLAAPGDRGTLDALLAAADGEFREADVDFAVVLHTFPAFHAGLGRWGFRKTRRPASTSQLLYLDRRGGQGPPPGDCYRGWALTYGDSDGHLW